MIPLQADDAAGNLTQDPSTIPVSTYQWDAEGRRTAVLQNGSTFQSATFNAFGQKVETIYPGYNSQGEQLFDPAGRELGVYGVTAGHWWDSDVWGAGRMLAQSYPSNTYFLHANNLGSDTQVTDYAGTVQTDFIYYPGGNWTNVGSMVDAHFAGFQQGAGPDYGTPTRRYSGSLSRWLSPDPMSGDVTNPQSLNRYAYVLNNPATFIDPLGLQCDSGSSFNVFYGNGTVGNFTTCVVRGFGGDALGGGFSNAGRRYAPLLDTGPDPGGHGGGAARTLPNTPATTAAPTTEDTLTPFARAVISRVYENLNGLDPEPCGGGIFRFHGAEANVGAVKGGGYTIVTADSQSGVSVGVLGEIGSGPVSVGLEDSVNTASGSDESGILFFIGEGVGAFVSPSKTQIQIGVYGSLGPRGGGAYFNIVPGGTCNP